MTSNPFGGSSKGKGKAPTDWRLRAVENVPTSSQLAALRLPFEVFPEQKDTVPAEFTAKVRHLTTPQEDAPWTGYYATFNGAKIAVSNIYGMWFEIRRRGQGFEAHRLARSELALPDLPLLGLDRKELKKSEEPITRPSSRAGPPPVEQPTPQDLTAWGPPSTPYVEPQSTQPLPYEIPRRDIPFDDDDDEPMDPPVGSSATNIPPRRPRGTGDDPMMITALDAPRDGYLRLEGNPPDRFDGSRERTLRFLTQFRRFMLMNNDVTIARDPIKKCAYFLSLIEGPRVEGWTERMYEWLDLVQTNPRGLIPFGSNAWKVVEREFKDAFTDYAEHE